jgi:hypothetical protein
MEWLLRKEVKRSNGSPISQEEEAAGTLSLQRSKALPGASRQASPLTQLRF